MQEYINDGSNAPIRFHYNQIRPQRTGQIHTTAMTKQWRPGVSKGNILAPNGLIYPYGHFDLQNPAILEQYNEFYDKNPEYLFKWNEPSSFVIEEELKLRKEMEIERMLRSADPDGLLIKEREAIERERDAQEWGDRIEIAIFGKIISR